MARLVADNVTLFRGERCLFRGLQFALRSGGILVLEGNNGTGKTSLLRAIAGLCDLEEGAVFWDGMPVVDQPQHYRSQLVWMAHRVGFKGDLTLNENLRFESALRRNAQTDFREVLARLEIEHLGKLPLRALSAGQQRRVALARLVLSDAPLWLMDEPTANLDRDGRALVVDLVSEHLARDGICVMAAHQNLHFDVVADVIRLQ